MGRQVLLVDDELALLQGLAPFLEDAGYEVLTAVDARAAMTILHRHRPEAIICDLRLPGMEGAEFYDTIQDNPDWCEIPFVFLTGEGEDAVQDRRAAGGVRRVLTKPFDPEDLVVILGEEVAPQP